VTCLRSGAQVGRSGHVGLAIAATTEAER
jgi:hypothetical protein